MTFPVFNGTGANVVALQALLPRWGAVVCAETAHIHTDEGGAPERMGSIKLLTVPTPDGKLTPELIDRQAWGFGDEHRAQPHVVSITQTTELGTCYTPDEMRAISDHAHALGMRVHLDGARISNAAATLGTACRALHHRRRRRRAAASAAPRTALLAARPSWCVNPELAADPSLGLVHLRKLSMQLASKMRFVSAQLDRAATASDLWLRSAGHANAMAARLAARSTALDGVADHPGRAGQRRLRRARPRRRRRAARAASASTTGTRPPARCAGCARWTPPRPTSTPSPPSCAASSPAPDRGSSPAAVDPFRVVGAP